MANQFNFNAILKAVKYAENKLLDEVVSDLNQEYVPYDTGALADSVYKTYEPTPSAKYTSSYAEYAFNSYTPSGKPKNYNQSHNPKAGAEPIEKCLEDNKQKYDQLLNNYLEEGLRKYEFTD